MKTIRVQRGPRSSSQSWGEPSIWTSFPRQGRRGRRGWIAATRRERTCQSPSACIHCRKVSADRTWPCRSVSFSAASVGPKSAYWLRTRARISCRRSCGKALLGRRPRRRDTKPWGPPPRSRASNRLTWRTLIPSRAAASCWRMRRSATCCIIPTRSTSLRLIVRFPSTHTPPSTQRGHFRIVQRGHYCFGLTMVSRCLTSLIP